MVHGRKLNYVRNSSNSQLSEEWAPGVCLPEEENMATDYLFVNTHKMSLFL